MYHFAKVIFKYYLRVATKKQMHKWNRYLPFGESVSDRWEKARQLGFGQGTSIYDSALVFGKVYVGDNTWIGPNVILDCSGAKLTIGSNCSISAGVQIYTHNSVDWSLSGGVKKADVAGVTIQDNCYIGPNVVIAKGVSIGPGAVVGANSFVNSDVPAHSKVWGVPAKVINE